MLRAAILAALLAVGCGGDQPSSDGGRLIPPGDDDHSDLETPETTGECSGDGDCEPSCTHSCAPAPTGPTTCPSDPPPPPERVADAACLCESGLCAWYE